jgi:hypothetical protein
MLPILPKINPLALIANPPPPVAPFEMSIAVTLGGATTRLWRVAELLGSMIVCSGVQARRESEALLRATIHGVSIFIRYSVEVKMRAIPQYHC